MATTNVNTALSKVRAGMSIFEVITAERINGIADALRAIIQGEFINSGDGISINKSGSSGITIARAQSDTEKELEERIRIVEERLNNLRAEVVCNPDGTFTITFTDT